MPQPWLIGVKKRAVGDEPIFLDKRLFGELFSLINLEGWPYKTNRQEFQLRDRALMSLLILTGLRISEVLMLRKLQFRVYNKKIMLKSVRTKKSGYTREKITLPKTGSLARFTDVFENWLRLVSTKEHYIFPCGTAYGFNWHKHLGRKRAFWIIKTTTGKFPHYFRAVCETIYGRIIFKNDAWKLKQFMGLKRLDSTTPYVQGSWEEDEHRIFEI